MQSTDIISKREELITQRLILLERLISYGFYWRNPEDVIEILLPILKKPSTSDSLCCVICSIMTVVCGDQSF